MIDGIKILQLIAAFGIIGCHLNLGAQGLITHFCDMNVSVFGAISGFLMALSLNRRGGSLKKYVNRRSARLLPPYIIWSILFVLATIVFDLLFDGARINPRFYDWYYWSAVIFRGSASCHLWFLIDLLYCQVILGALWFLFPKVGRSGVFHLLIAILSCGMASFCEGHFFIYFVRLFGAVNLGIAIYQLSTSYKIKQNIILFTIPIMLILHVLLPGIPAFIRDFICIVPILLFFSNFKDLHLKNRLGLFDSSMGIYIIHPLFAVGTSWIIHRIFSIPIPKVIVILDWLGIFLLSFLSISILKRFPICRRFIQ